jgi:glycosyltransferase involved in cell wall biosynthesis
MAERKIAFFLPNLAGGGAERIVVNLLKGMQASGVPLDLVVASLEGPNVDRIPDRVRVINLATGRVFTAIPALSRYLNRERPIALISHLNHANIVALLARKLSGSKIKLILVEHSTLSVAKAPSLRAKTIPPLMRWLYPQADIVVAVSQGVAQDLEEQLQLQPQTVKVVYNPVVDDDLLDRAKLEVEHPWFQPESPPVILAVGRFSIEKDFLNLIRAFAIVRKQRPARLLILGEGPQRSELEAEIARLEIAADVSLPGFVENPYAYMSRAATLVLSSRREGLPTVLIEAMACGCPVVATDCLSGPREILAAGKYGRLVPIENAAALADAMLQTLDRPFSRDVSIDRGMYFSNERAVAEYLALVEAS